MKRLLIFAFILFLAVSGYAAFPTHYNTATVDVSKVTGNFDSFNWVWQGVNDQSNRLTFAANKTNGFPVSYVDLTGFYPAFRISKKGTVYVDKRPDSITISTSSILFGIARTNIPPNDTYQAEVWLYDSAATNTAVTLAQGTITITKSLYSDTNNFPFPATADLTGYLLASTFQAHTNLTTTAHGGIATTAQGALADTAIQPATLYATNTENSVRDRLYTDAATNAAIAEATNQSGAIAAALYRPLTSQETQTVGQAMAQGTSFENYAITNVGDIVGTNWSIRTAADGTVAFRLATVTRLGLATNGTTTLGAGARGDTQLRGGLSGGGVDFRRYGGITEYSGGGMDSNSVWRLGTTFGVAGNSASPFIVSNSIATAIGQLVANGGGNVLTSGCPTQAASTYSTNWINATGLVAVAQAAAAITNNHVGDVTVGGTVSGYNGTETNHYVTIGQWQEGLSGNVDIYATAAKIITYPPTNATYLCTSANAIGPQSIVTNVCETNNAYLYGWGCTNQSYTVVPAQTVSGVIYIGEDMPRTLTGKIEIYRVDVATGTFTEWGDGGTAFTVTGGSAVPTRVPFEVGVAAVSESSPFYIFARFKRTGGTANASDEFFVGSGTNYQTHLSFSVQTSILLEPYLKKSGGMMSGNLGMDGSPTRGMVVTNIDTSASDVTFVLAAPANITWTLVKTNAFNSIFVVYGSATNTVGGVATIDCLPIGAQWWVRY